MDYNLYTIDEIGDMVIDELNKMHQEYSQIGTSIPQGYFDFKVYDDILCTLNGATSDPPHGSIIWAFVRSRRALEWLSGRYVVEFLCTQNVDLYSIQRFLDQNPECDHLHIRGGHTNLRLLRLPRLTYLSIRDHHIDIYGEESRDSLIYLSIDDMCRVETDFPNLEYCTSESICDQIQILPRDHGAIAHGMNVECLKTSQISFKISGLKRLHTLTISEVIHIDRLPEILNVRSLRHLELDGVDCHGDILDCSLRDMVCFKVRVVNCRGIDIHDVDDLVELAILSSSPITYENFDIDSMISLKRLGVSMSDSIRDILDICGEISVIIHDLDVRDIIDHQDILDDLRVTCQFNDVVIDPSELLPECHRINNQIVMDSLRRSIMSYYQREANRALYHH